MTAVAGDALEKVEIAALDWVLRNFEFFKPQSHRDPRRTAFIIKAAAELALLCALSTKYATLAARVWEEIFRDERVQDYMLANPAQVPCVGFYASMRQCGFEDARYRQRISALLDTGYLSALEHPPSNELDFLFSLRHAGFAADRDEPVFRRTLLGRHPPARYLTTDDVYTMTHAIFFTTDFGRTDPEFFTDEDRRYFADVLPQLAGYYVSCQDWDLTAELLIALHAVRLRPPIVDIAWNLLSLAQAADGSFPGPAEGKPDSNGEATGAAWIAFRDDYHTTLAVLLAILTARPA